MSQTAVSVPLVVLPLVCALSLSGQTPTSAAVQRAARAYVDAMNKGDASALAGLFAREVGVVAIQDGKIMRGWDAIRTEADSMVSAGDQFSLGSIDVTPLGPLYALAVASLNVTFRTDHGEEQVRAALSLLFKKTMNRWTIIHSHTSTMPMEDAEGANIAGSSSLDAVYVASMKSDLRNLVIAEEAFFADSVHYTSKVGRGGINFSVAVGNTVPTIRLTADGWTASIGNANAKTRCVIFVGSTAIPPATREGEPICY